MFHRGPLLSVYSPQAGRRTVVLPAGQQARPLVFDPDEQTWRAEPTAAARGEWTSDFAAGETRFFVMESC